MNFKAVLILSFSILLGDDPAKNALGECCGRCVGSAYCTACTSCNYCKHCNSGGSCGVCGGGVSKNSDPGYINKSKSYERINPPSKEPTNKKRYVQYYVNTRYLNVRSGPGTSYSVIDKISYYTNVRIERFSTNGGWCYISYYGTNSSLRSGYVVQAYLAYYTL